VVRLKPIQRGNRRRQSGDCGIRSATSTSGTKAAEAQELLQQVQRLYQEASQSSIAGTGTGVATATSWCGAASDRSLKLPVIRQLQQGSATAQAAQQATNTLTHCCRHQPPSPPKPEVGSTALRVRISKLGNTAEVLSSPDEDGKLTVRFGIMKMTVGLEDMNRWMVKSRTAVKAKPASVATPLLPPQPAPAIRTSQNTVDLRGRADAAWI